MMNYLQLRAEIETCKYLFLREINEPKENSLRLVIEEGRVGSESSSRYVAGVKFTDLHRIESTKDCRLFEITWDSYVAYSVRNESFVTRDDSEKAETGGLFSVYSKSKFLDFVSRTTFANSEFPGPLHHVCVACGGHIIDVVSTIEPLIVRIRPE